ncbi:zinc finger domain-containing protein, partial [Sulfobacillus thermosulfidooxidans]|uniref:zinc finger domain-containing protein n=1 Tax=Sulfobacillus thermosulfidooxidans TaxID=28034 RepID=UPI003083372A
KPAFLRPWMGEILYEPLRIPRPSTVSRQRKCLDYVDALGHPGQNQDYLMVYGRNQAECRVCGQPIVTKVIQGRTSHFCLHCQK